MTQTTQPTIKFDGPPINDKGGFQEASRIMKSGNALRGQAAMTNEVTVIPVLEDHSVDGPVEVHSN